MIAKGEEVTHAHINSLSDTHILQDMSSLTFQFTYPPLVRIKKSLCVAAKNLAYVENIKGFIFLRNLLI